MPPRLLTLQLLLLPLLLLLFLGSSASLPACCALCSSSSADRSSHGRHQDRHLCQKRAKASQPRAGKGQQRAAGCGAGGSRRCGDDGSAGLALQGRGFRCGALRSPSKLGVEASPLSAPRDCSRAGSIQAAWAQPHSGYAGNPQTSAPQGTECYRLLEPAQGGHSLGHASWDQGGGRCSCSLAAPLADRVPGRLHLSTPAPSELKLSRMQLRRPRPQIREGDCRISSWVGVLWLFE